jgi:hypothetical protein
MIRAQRPPRVLKDPPYVEMDCNYHWIGLSVHYCGHIAKLHHHHLPGKSNHVVFPLDSTTQCSLPQILQLDSSQ